jgi:DHA1 family bicyclomycin/chloramphenicol resistance-like MFS transporter
LAGAMLAPGTGAYPLLYIQLLTGAVGVAAILLVIARQRQLGL